MDYSITITTTQETLNYLKAQGYTLYGFKGIVSSNPQATPTVWFSLSPTDPSFGTATNIQWSSPLYIGQCSVSPGTPIISGKKPWPSNPGKEVELDNVYTYTSDGWNPLPENGDPNHFSINNHVSTGITKFYVASSLVTLGNESPIIVVDALPDGSVNFTPIETVAFIFAQKPYNVGTLIAQAFSGGCMVTFTGNPTSVPIVNYDPLGDGWTCDNVPKQFRKFQSGTSLYKAMTNFSYAALKSAREELEALLPTRHTLALMEAWLGIANTETVGGRCTCKDGKIESNKCKDGFKPKCRGGDDCECVQK